MPRSLREGAYALGATKLDVTAGVVVPAALSGIMASFLLAIARAVGETMAVTLAAGKRPQMTLNPLNSIQTMTAYIVETTKGDTPAASLEYQTIFAVGLTLFFTTLAPEHPRAVDPQAHAREVRMNAAIVNMPRDRTPRRPPAAFAWLCAGCTAVSLGVLLLLLWQVVVWSWGWLDWQFITNFDSQLSPEKAGVLAALVGSIYLIGLTALFAVPIGVGAAIYLEEYATRSRWRSLVQTNIANLAGVPSIVYGILGLGLFVRGMKMGPGVLAGALTLTLVVLPIVILASQEALRAVPSTIRQASYALGATRWQTVCRQLLPAALPGILTGVILALARALGEAAPLVAIGAAGYVAVCAQGRQRSFHRPALTDLQLDRKRPARIPSRGRRRHHCAACRAGGAERYGRFFATTLR